MESAVARFNKELDDLAKSHRRATSAQHDPNAFSPSVKREHKLPTGSKVSRPSLFSPAALITSGMWSALVTQDSEVREVDAGTALSP
jgi:hypothetical protein